MHTRTPQSISQPEQPPKYELMEIQHSTTKPVENLRVVRTGAGVAVVNNLPARASAIRPAIV